MMTMPPSQSLVRYSNIDENFFVYKSDMYNGIFYIYLDDDGSLITVYGDEEKRSILGSISLAYDCEGRADGEVYKITNLSLDKCKRKGVGTQCLLAHIDTFGSILFAESNDGIKRGDGSHLTGDGVPFIMKMRQLGIVVDDCQYEEYPSEESD